MPQNHDSKLMDMLTGYAAAHQHPFNVFVHMIGIPLIMLGVVIPLTWVGVPVFGVTITPAHLLLAGFFGFYLTLDRIFAFTFLVVSVLIVVAALRISLLPLAQSGTIAAAAFVGGYIAQFVGHAVERSMPVLVKHPIQAQLAAPFFWVVELYNLLGLRSALFQAVMAEVESRRTSDGAAAGACRAQRGSALTKVFSVSRPRRKSLLS